MASVTARRGGAIEYEVERPPWRAWTASSHAAEGTWEKLYGPGFAEALETPAVSALIAEGSAVSVKKPLRLDA